MALATSTYLAMEIWTGRMSQVWLMPLVLSMGLWRKLLADGLGRLGALGVGLLSGVTFLSYWYYGFFGGIAGGLLLVTRDRRFWAQGPWREFLLFCLRLY